MNWGRKKKKTSSSSMPGRGISSISKMFHISWISRLRQGNGNENERKVKRNTGLPVEEDKVCRVEKFYGEAEENFWRLSFSDEGVHGRKSIEGCPESYDWLDKSELSPYASTCRSCGAKSVSKVVKKESKSIDFNDMLLDMRKTRVSNAQVGGETRTDGLKSIVSRRDGKLKNLDFHQLSHGCNGNAKCTSLMGKDKKVPEGDSSIQNLAVKDIEEVEALKPPQASMQLQHEASKHSKLGGLECKNSVVVNLAELSLGNGEERKSIYINKDSLKRRSKTGRSCKVNVYSPRTPSKAELCKIRALEDLKKTRMKMRRVKEKEEKDKAVLESLAVVKRSFDPERDFRNSMLEMIVDKGISQAEELEELLACYLILNSDEYHDMIIKVFRQVWFDLNKDHSLDPLVRDAELCNF